MILNTEAREAHAQMQGLILAPDGVTSTNTRIGEALTERKKRTLIYCRNKRDACTIIVSLSITIDFFISSPDRSGYPAARRYDEARSKSE